MQIKIEKTFRVDAPIEEVWALLTDPEQVVSCMPGADLEVVDERNFKGRVGLKVGPVRAQYRGEARFEELDAERYYMRIAGEGTGSGSASVVMTGQLRSLEDGGTEADVAAEVAMTGRLVQVGSRLIQFVSDQLFDQFVERLRDRLESRTEEA